MLIRTHDNGFNHPLGSEITPQAVYQDRRRWLQQAALGLGGAALTSVAARQAWAQGAARPGKLAALSGAPSAVPGARGWR